MPAQPASKPLRDPAATRRAVLLAAFEEIHRQGFQAASLNSILAATGLTKGALYHHFDNKQSLGYAVLEEVVAPMVRQTWIAPLLENAANPVDTLAHAIRTAGHDMTMADIQLGCPLNNLAQEMSPVDEGFRLRINALFDEWRRAIATGFERGKAAGQVRPEVDEQAAAAFIVGALEGCVGMAKNARSHEVLMQCGQGVLAYLDSLRP